MNIVYICQIIGLDHAGSNDTVSDRPICGDIFHSITGNDYPANIGICLHNMGNMDNLTYAMDKCWYVKYNSS